MKELNAQEIQHVSGGFLGPGLGDAMATMVIAMGVAAFVGGIAVGAACYYGYQYFTAK